MHVVFYASDKPREQMLAKALRDGAAAFGDTVEVRRTADYGDDCKYEGPTPDTDCAVCFGSKGKSKRILEDHWLMGRKTLFLDKGYSRQKGEAGHTLFTRIAVNGYEPSAHMMQRPRPSDRWDRLGIELERRRKAPGGHVLVAGSSEKFYEFRGIGEQAVVIPKLFSTLRRRTLRQLVYRPKPSAWKRPVPPYGDWALSPGSQTITHALRGAHCLVTHGASAAIDAVLQGVPAICLISCAASPVSGDSLAGEHCIEEPFFPRPEDRLKWAYALAYCQWTSDEIRSGEAWADLKGLMK